MTEVSVIPPSIDAFSPKNQAMAFTSVTAVLRAAGLAADHHQPHRAVFERLDGSVGCVERRAQLLEERAAAPRRPLRRAGLALGPAQGPARGARGVRRARRAPAGRRTSCSRARTSTAVADDPEGAEVFAEAEAAWQRAARRTCAAACTWRCCRWTMPTRTP